jgi:hypothetical protein
MEEPRRRPAYLGMMIELPNTVFPTVNHQISHLLCRYSPFPIPLEELICPLKHPEFDHLYVVSTRTSGLDASSCRGLLKPWCRSRCRHSTFFFSRFFSFSYSYYVFPKLGKFLIKVMKSKRDGESRTMYKAMAKERTSPTCVETSLSE